MTYHRLKINVEKKTCGVKVKIEVIKQTKGRNFSSFSQMMLAKFAR